jgi:hypothetical protein
MMKKASIATAVFVVLAAVGTAPAVPYSVDSHTLHLYHFDGDGKDSVTVNPIDLVLDSGATATDAKLPGLGQALYTYEGTNRTNVNLPSALATTALAIRDFVGPDGAFTFEALVCPVFALGSIPNGMQIVSGEHNSTRGWQFRVVPAGDVQFINLTGTIQTMAVPLPRTGPHAYVPDKWFHVAVTYNGQPNTDGNMKFYWTALDAGVCEAVLLGSARMTANLNPAVTPNFVIGNDGRENNGRTENWEGWIDEVRISAIARAPSDMAPCPDTSSARLPSPADKATDVPAEVVLSWLPGAYARSHDVYLGPAAAEVSAAGRSNPMGTLVSQGQAQASYSAGRLPFGQTYYWRVDEVNAPPDSMIVKGSIWSFTIEPYSYPIPNVTATAASMSTPQMGPEKTVDGSGLAGDRHGTESTDMWLSSTSGPEGAWIQYSFDQAYKLDRMQIWNSNQLIESLLGFGTKAVTVEYSTEAGVWKTLGNFEFARAPGAADYIANTTVDLAGVVAQHVRLTIRSNWGGLTSQYGLSEVRFFHVPTAAREPSPVPGAIEVAPQVTLRWRAGREAGAHQVFLGTDPEALSLAATIQTPSYEADLSLDQTYSWRIVEVNEAKDPAAWTSEIWSFSTQKFLVVDDFESYTDDMDKGQAIFQTWIDGFEVQANGSIVGNNAAPFAERSVVQDGKQAMPLTYANTDGATYSEAERRFAEPQDWTRHGCQTLAVSFFGAPDNTGRMYLKIDNTKIPYGGQADDLRRAQWQAWNIDLAAGGANLKSVTKIAIGIDGAGAAGLLRFDSIVLYPSVGTMITPTDPGTTGLVAHYQLDGNAQDAAGGHHGTLSGAPQPFEAGKMGQALRVTDDLTYVLVPYAADLALNTFTVSVWGSISPTCPPSGASSGPVSRATTRSI